MHHSMRRNDEEKRGRCELALFRTSRKTKRLHERGRSVCLWRMEKGETITANVAECEEIYSGDNSVRTEWLSG